MKVVSERFVHREKRAMVSVERPCPSRTTATGLPRRGTEEKTSFCTNLRLTGEEEEEEEEDMLGERGESGMKRMKMQEGRRKEWLRKGGGRNIRMSLTESPSGRSASHSFRLLHGPLRRNARNGRVEYN